jgi:hypothetical protein
MAAQFDAMGNYLGDYETEEERKKREELGNTAVHTQEIKTYGDGTQEKITKEEIPGAIAPKTMLTAAGPVSPDTFARMQQAESGGRDFAPNGQPLTSPAGAMFRNQVMPATAANPGYGVRPAQAQTPEEYNRVGQDYYQALLKQFGGDERKAAAAYNAGPGRVQQNMARNQGQMNEAQLPRETQGYLGKVFNAMIPSAQAGTLPPGQAQRAPTITPGAPTAPVAPGQMPQMGQPQMQIDENGNRLITNADGTTTVLGPDNKPLAAGGMEPRDTPQFRNRLFEEAGKDPFKWMEIAKNPEYAQFPAMQTVAKEQTRALLEQEFQMNAAKEQTTKLVAAASQGDPKASRAIADELKSQQGSWAKMILLGFLSPQLAGEEAVKLGFGNKWTSATNDKGETALIQVNAKGLPLKGINADNTAIPQEQLASYMTGGGLGKGTSLSAEVYVDPTTGARYRSGYDNAGKAALVNIQGGAPYKGDPRKLTLQSIGTTQAKADIGLITDLKKKHGTNVLDAEKDYVAINGPFKSAEDRAQFRQAYGFDLAQPAGAPAQVGGQVVQGGAPTQTAPAGGAPAGTTTMPAGGNVNVPLTQQKQNVEVSETYRKEVVKKAGDIVASSDKLVGEITNAERAATDALTKPNNFGTLIHGQIPGEYTMGELFKTQDAVNTKNVLEVVNKVAATNAKMLGTNPTDRDLQFVTSTKPDETWSAEAVADWLRKSADGTRRTLDFARKQVETGGKFVPETPQQAPEAPTKRLSKEERDAVEWLRKNPNDPRAPEIKKRLGL